MKRSFHSQREAALDRMVYVMDKAMTPKKAPEEPVRESHYQPRDSILVSESKTVSKLPPGGKYKVRVSSEKLKRIIAANNIDYEIVHEG